MAQLGMSPPTVDEMYVWQAAVLLGADLPEDATTPDGTPASGDDDGRELLRQRVAHARGEGPKPEARPVDPAAVQALTKAFS